MEKLLSRGLILLIFTLTCFANIAWSAGKINFTGRAGLFNPTASNASASVMYGVGVTYDFNENWMARAALETTTYKVAGQDTTYMPATVDLIYGQQITPFLRPYAGAGLSYNSTTRAGTTLQTTGAQAVAGLKFGLGGFDAGIEYRYMVPDLNHTDKADSSTNIYGVASVSQSISF